MSTIKVNDIREATPQGGNYTLPRAHARVSQTNTALYSAHNLSSISDNGNGATTFTFRNNFKNVDYAIISSSDYNSQDQSVATGLTEVKSSTTSSVRISGMTYEGKAYDNTRIDIAVFGDLT